MPITLGVCRVLDDPARAREVVQALLAREQKREY
jgi:glycerol-3-phosphate dehydrogenase